MGASLGDRFCVQTCLALLFSVESKTKYLKVSKLQLYFLQKKKKEKFEKILTDARDGNKSKRSERCEKFSCIIKTNISLNPTMRVFYILFPFTLFSIPKQLIQRFERLARCILPFIVFTELTTLCIYVYYIPHIITYSMGFT